MRILFVDRDVERVRKVHSEILSYGGVPWDLVHCAGLSDAEARLALEPFDAMLLSATSPTTAEDFESVIATADLPCVVVLDEDCLASQISFVKQGAADGLVWHELDGDNLMRRLRLAVSRSHRDTATIQRLRHQWAHAAAGDLPTDDKPGEAALQVAMAKCDADLAALDSHQALRLIFVGGQMMAAGDIETRPAITRAAIRVNDLATAAEELSNHPPVHGVVVDQEALEREGFEELQRLRTRGGSVPVVMLMNDTSDSAAVSCIEQGIEDCYAKATISAPILERAVRLSWARLLHLQRRVNESIERRPGISDRRGDGGSRGDRRSSPRYLITCPVIAIPVLPNLAPEKHGICEAFTFDVSTGGVGIQMASKQVLPSRNWVLGFEGIYDDHSHDWHFANVVTRNAVYSPGGIQLNMQFQNADEDLFRMGNLQPVLQPETHRLLPALPLSILEDWMEVGVLRRVVLNRIKTCPECSGVALVGEGCHECGAAQIEYRDLLHHFACAYVGDASEFKSEDGVACPKCLARIGSRR